MTRTTARRSPSSARADSPSGSAAVARASRRRAPAAQISLQPAAVFLVGHHVAPAEEVGQRERAGAPHRGAKSCGPAVMTAAASSGGGSISSAHCVSPRYDRPIVANRPVNHGCRRSHSTVSAPSEVSWTIGWNSPPEPEVPRTTLQHHVVAAGGVEPGVERRERKAPAVRAADQQRAGVACAGRRVMVGDQVDAVAHRHPAALVTV